MITFNFSLEPFEYKRWKLVLATVGREAGGEAIVVSKSHDRETDTYSYWYFDEKHVGLIFCTDVSVLHGGKPTWETDIHPLEYQQPSPERPPTDEPPDYAAPIIGVLRDKSPMPERPFPAEQSAYVTRVVDALAQWPNRDLRLLIPGKAVRDIIVRKQEIKRPEGGMR